AGVSFVLAGDRLEELVRLEDPRVGEAIEHGAALTSRGHEAGGTQNREMLAHVGHLAGDPAGQLADRQLADGERFEHAQPLRIGEGATYDGRALVFRLAVLRARRASGKLDCHVVTMSRLAQSRKSTVGADGRLYAPADARSRRRNVRSAVPAVRGVRAAEQARRSRPELDPRLRAPLGAEGSHRRASARPRVERRHPPGIDLYRPAIARRV